MQRQVAVHDVRSDVEKRNCLKISSIPILQGRDLSLVVLLLDPWSLRAGVAVALSLA
jgi:hypothetical protein